MKSVRAASDSAGARRAAPWRRALRTWQGAARAIGVVQTRLIMMVVYAVIVLPMGIVFRLVKDPLHMQPPKGGNWTPCEKQKPGLDAARQQF